MKLDRRLLSLARHAPLSILLTILSGFFGSVLTILQALLLARAVRMVFLDGVGLSQIQEPLWLLAFLSLLRAGSIWLAESAGNRAALRIKSELRQALVARLNQHGPAALHQERTGELVSLLVDGVEALDAYFSQYLPQVALSVLAPAAILAFVFPIDPLSGLVLALTAPLIPIFMILIGSLAESLTRRQWRSLSRMSAYFLDVLQGLITLKILGRSRAQVAVITAVSERFREVTMSVLRVTFLSALVLEMVATLSTAVVAVQVGLRLLYGMLTFEQAFFVLILAPEFYLPLRQLGARFHAGMAGVAAAQRIFSVLSTAPDAPSRTEDGERIPLPAPVIFQDVHFTYPDGRRGLCGASFRLDPGEKVALVGASGSGKTTIAQLLLRFLEPQVGEIRVGGHNLGSLTAGSWRSQLAWVPQHPYLFHDSLENNIRLARPQASRAEVEAAARLAFAHDFIQALPHGYATSIGERGARLSAGQAQRIALARAFLKDAPLILFDEATANLDPAHERLVQESLETLLAGRTALVIAHRLSTVMRLPRVVVLKDGQVVEDGSPQDLLARGGEFARLASAWSGAVSEVPEETSTTLRIAGPPTAVPGTRSAEPLPPSPGPPHPTRVLLRLLRLVAPFSAGIALATLSGFAAIASSIGLIGASAYIISAAALQPSIAELQVAIVGVRFFGISRGLFRYLERLLSHQVTFRLLARLRVGLYQALEPLAPARLLDFRSGDLLARLTGDIEALENFYVRALAPPLIALCVGVFASLYLGSYAPRLGWVLAAALLLAGLGVPILARWLTRRSGAALIESRSALSLALVDGLQGMPDLQAFGQDGPQAERIFSIGQRLATAQRAMAQVSGLQSALEYLIASLGAWTILALAVPLVRTGEFSGVYLAVLVLVALSSFEATQPLPMAAGHLASSLAAAGRLFEVADAEPEVQEGVPPRLSGDGPPAEPPQPLPASFHLQVSGLSFHYPSEDGPPTIKDVSFDLPPGKRLAIVGPSGAGKSTLIHLLLRFWEYRQGSILLNGEELRGYEPEQVRKAVGVVSQHTYLFNASLRDNLLLANPQAAPPEIERALQLAQLDGFVARLPDGLDTFVGEQGLNLSGGERQRVAIARALLKDPPLLILDEPTANLDPVTERAVLQALDRLSAGRSVLLVTHRLVDMERMDEILVLDQGRVIERGTLQALRLVGGLYRQMEDLQNEVFISRSAPGPAGGPGNP